MACGPGDTVAFVVFLATLLAVFGCLFYTWIVGDSRIVFYNIDSAGNLCGAANSNGEDLTNRPLLFIFDSFYFPHLSHSICTDVCPSYDLITKLAVYSYANETKHKLCKYELPISSYISASYGRTGQCPFLPVLKSVDYLQVCVPGVALNSYQSLAYVDLVVPLLNQSFRSIYHYWAYDAVGIVAAFFLSFLLFTLLRCAYKCVLAAIMPILMVTIIAGVGSLWFAYHIVCKRLSSATKVKLPLTNFEIYNEIALFVFSIILSVAAFFILLVLLINCRSFPVEIDRLFKMFAKFIDSVKIVVWLPVISCIFTTIALVGGVAAAYCALGLVEIVPPVISDQFSTVLPEPPYKERPERKGVAFAVVLSLFWFPRIVVNSVKLATHLSVSQFIIERRQRKSFKNYGIKPSWFNLMCTVVTMSFVESITLPFSFISGVILAVISPLQKQNNCFSSFLRSVTFWIPVAYAEQASVSETKTDSHHTFYKAVVNGLYTFKDESRNKNICNAMLAGEWFLICVATAICSLPVCVVILQMRYDWLITLSTPSIFLVLFFGYWIAVSTYAPFSAAFITFCLRYEDVTEILFPSRFDKIEMEKSVRQNEENEWQKS